MGDFPQTQSPSFKGVGEQDQAVHSSLPSTFGYLATSPVHQHGQIWRCPIIEGYLQLSSIIRIFRDMDHPKNIIDDSWLNILILVLSWMIHCPQFSSNKERPGANAASQSAHLRGKSWDVMGSPWIRHARC